MTIYLYVKQHSITGLKYFGKTIQSDPYSYMGSGIYWVPHINKHGREFVETIQLWEFEDQEEASKFALQFSEENNIVKSEEWANLIQEDCKTGGSIFLGKNHTKEGKKNISNGLKGRKLSDEHRKAISDRMKGKKKTSDHIAKVAESKRGTKYKSNRTQKF